MFRGVGQDANKKLLQSALGEKWKGLLFADWVDEVPVWRPSKGYIHNLTNLRSSHGHLVANGQYQDWDRLEQDYYQLFNELKDQNVIRSSRLTKNNIEIHSWKPAAGK
ncbi:hypothetical protein ACFPES_33235 [Paenibacillus sp. GCM10023248]|uniref:hypothetical protein n=1 Tax=Bacillus sp. 3255 TaxID=2817904 RepID=UPI00286AC41D|nr:hypothetical protein [Bacillus sp. 3255]MDD9271904.1 hypothetical protein [Paenibacillus sp. MAHUQ-63]